MSRRVLLAIALLTVPFSAFAAVRLTYPMGGTATPVAWPASSFPVRYKLDARLANSTPAIERSFGAWSAVSDANVTFQSDGSGSGLRAGYDQQNTVSLLDGLYRDQGFIAVTTNWYDDRGRMTESDIQIDPLVASGSYNLQQTLEHEIGHMLGLDHSAVLSSVMYPYVSRGGTTILDSDDRIAIASVYPKSDPILSGGTLSGRVVGDQGGVFAAQIVAVSEQGEPVATGLTNSSGEFLLQRVPPGSYRLYAEPLDGPVDPMNLAGVWRDAKVVAFRTEFLEGAPLRVESGRVYGNLIVTIAAAPVRLNPRWIGTNASDREDFSLSSSPVTIRPGQSVTIAVGGDGFTSGMTTFEVLNPRVQRISEFRYAANYAYATFLVAGEVLPGSAVILVRNGNETATLTGALRIEAAGRSRAARL